jgi:hypothetical protein
MPDREATMSATEFEEGGGPAGPGTPAVERTRGIGRGSSVRERSARRRVIWGVLLIALGAIFLLAKLDLLEIRGIRHWWPAIPIAIGAVWMAAPDRPRQIASGLTLVLLGLWCFACLRHWMGLTFGNSWPVTIVVFGVEMVFAALLDARQALKEDRHV